MVLSDSQLSMIPLCLELLFTLVDYIFVICLTKCLSWLVGVHSSLCSRICVGIIVSMFLFISVNSMKFWATIGS